MASVAGSSSDAFFWVASRMKVSDRMTSSSARIDFCVRRRGARPCAEIRRYRAAAAPDRLGFHLAQAVGVVLQWSWPKVHIVVPLRRDPPVVRHLHAAERACRSEYWLNLVCPLFADKPHILRLLSVFASREYVTK